MSYFEKYSSGHKWLNSYDQNGFKIFYFSRIKMTYKYKRKSRKRIYFRAYYNKTCRCSILYAQNCISVTPWRRKMKFRAKGQTNQQKEEVGEAFFHSFPKNMPLGPSLYVMRNRVCHNYSAWYRVSQFSMVS